MKRDGGGDAMWDKLLGYIGAGMAGLIVTKAALLFVGSAPGIVIGLAAMFVMATMKL